MLVEVAEVAMAQAATQSLRTLADDSTMVVDNESAADGPPRRLDPSTRLAICGLFVRKLTRSPSRLSLASPSAAYCTLVNRTFFRVVQFLVEENRVGCYFGRDLPWPQGSGQIRTRCPLRPRTRTKRKEWDPLPSLLLSPKNRKKQNKSEKGTSRK